MPSIMFPAARRELPAEIIAQIFSSLPPSAAIVNRRTLTAWNQQLGWDTPVLRDILAAYDTHDPSDSARRIRAPHDEDERLEFLQYSAERYKRHIVGWPYAMVLKQSSYRSMEHVTSHVEPLLKKDHFVHSTSPLTLSVQRLRLGERPTLIVCEDELISHVLTDSLYAYIDGVGIHVRTLVNVDKESGLLEHEDPDSPYGDIGGSGSTLLLAKMSDTLHIELLMIEARGGRLITTKLEPGSAKPLCDGQEGIEHVMHDAAENACYVLTICVMGRAVKIYRYDLSEKAWAHADIDFQLPSGASFTHYPRRKGIVLQSTGKQREWLMSVFRKGYQAVVQIDESGVLVSPVIHNGTQISAWKDTAYQWSIGDGSEDIDEFESRPCRREMIQAGTFRAVDDAHRPLRTWQTRIVTRAKGRADGTEANIILVNDSYLIDIVPYEHCRYIAYTFDPGLSVHLDELELRVELPEQDDWEPVLDTNASKDQHSDTDSGEILVRHHQRLYATKSDAAVATKASGIHFSWTEV